jgi:hypothetical protein
MITYFHISMSDFIFNYLKHIITLLLKISTKTTNCCIAYINYSLIYVKINLILNNIYLTNLFIQ